MSDTSDSRSDTMDDCMAAMVLMRLSVSPKSPRFSGSDSVASSLSSCVASSATSSAASSSLCSSIEPHSLPTSGVSSLGSSTGSSSSSSSASASSTSSASSGFGALALFDLELARRADGRRTEYRCKLCGVQFVAFDTVLRHIRFAHLDNNPAKRHHDEEEYYTRVEVKLDALHDQAIKNYGEIDAMDDEGIDEIDQNNDYCCSTECADAHSLVELQISQQQSQQLEVEKSANEMQSRCRRRCAEAGDYCSKLAVEPSVVETTIVASGMEEFVASFEAVEHNDSNNDIAKDDDDDGFGAHNDCRQDEEDDIMTLSDESTDDALSRPPTPQGSPSSSATSLLQSGDSRLRASSEGTTTENKGLMSGHVNICQLGQPSRSPLAEPTDEPLEETKPMIQSEQACLASGSRALVASARQVAGSVASSVQQTSITSQPKSALPQNSIFMSSAPTLSHLDMVRPPHEDPELQLVSSHYQHQHQQPLQNHYQHHQQQPHLQQSQQHQQRNGKFLSSSSPINIPPHFRHHCHSQHHHSGHHSHHHQQQQLQHSTHNGGGCSQLAQLQQQQQHHHSHPQQQQQQKKLQTKIQHHNMSPKHRNRGRSESRKCRKVYGMENRDQWCTQCKWKKACTRFTD